MALVWTPKPGDCLFIESGPIGKHLFVIVIDSFENGQHNIVSVPICTVRDHARVDEACLLKLGDHVFIKADSFVQYRDARLDSMNHLIKCVQDGTFIPHDPVSEALLYRIKIGLVSSIFVKRHIKDLLRNSM